LTASGRLGGAYVFDGTDLIRVPSAPELNTSQGFTVTAWVNRVAGAPDACVVNKGVGTNGNNSWQACIGNGGGVAFFSAGANGAHPDQFSTTLLDPGRWYHIALWWNGTTKATYVNGSREAADDGIVIAFDDSDITLGVDIDGTMLVDPFNGQLDDVRIYNRALSPTELTELQSP